MSTRRSGIHVDKKDFRRQTKAFAKLVGVNAGEVLRIACGYFTLQLIKSPFPSGKAFGGTVRQIMRRAIENDLRRAFTVLKPEQGKLTGINRLEIDGMLAHHNRAQHPRTGRVAPEYGRSGAMDRPVIDAQQFRKLSAAMARRIGFMQAGWMPGVIRFGGGRVPGYVAKHMQAPGTTRDRVRKDGGGWAESVNRVKWANRFYKKGGMRIAAIKTDRYLARLLDFKIKDTIAIFNRMRAKA